MQLLQTIKNVEEIESSTFTPSFTFWFSESYHASLVIISIYASYVNLLNP